MKWENRKVSTNIEDRRGSRTVAKTGGGILGIVLFLVGAYYGVDLSGVARLMEGAGGGTTTQNVPVQETREEAQLHQFVSVVLAETEDTWEKYFRQHNARYVAPKLVLYRGTTPTACGTGQAAMGPFYCPGDQKVYLDLSFYDRIVMLVL